MPSERIDNIAQAKRLPRQVAPGRGAQTGSSGGQAPFVPTDHQRAQVMKYVACGFTVDSIAVIMSIPTATLERHFPAELRDGKTIVDGKVLGGIVERAIEGDRAFAIFYAKARGGWSERSPAIDGSAAAAVFSISVGGGGKPSDSAAEIKVSVIPQIEGTIEEEGEP